MRAIMATIATNLQAVRSTLDLAASRAMRPSAEITLLAVSKTFPADAIRDAYQAGQTAFGESYLQEALDKMALLSDLPLQWHFIGPIQSNKTRAIAEHFSWVHSVDRVKIAERLSAQRPPQLPPLNVCLQVNVSNEVSKSGVSPTELPALAQAVLALPNLRLRGLMAIPAPAANLDSQRLPFSQLRALMHALNAQGLPLDTLSMGMSQDMEAAILEGATIVRVGSAIFGHRNYGEQ
jgi:PLP dependent protein